MTFAFAHSATVPQLCSLFNAAFSDYIIPMELTEPVMEMKLKRDGTDLNLSPLAIYKDKPVGFILYALGDWKNKRTAYNGGTGVVPKARGRALTEKLFCTSLPALQENKVAQLLLEVLEENTRALKIYLALGFAITRRLRCFRHAKADVNWHTHSGPKEINLKIVSSANWSLYQTFWDVEPSWQHHTAAIVRSQDYVKIVEARLKEETIGYGIVYPLTGSVAQLAVAKTWRGKGIGQILVQKMIELTNAPAISFINVEEAGTSLLQFLTARKITETLAQFEMIKALD